jgi:oligopeptide/dipeptide ABC transporter ATP-binding protein
MARPLLQVQGLSVSVYDREIVQAVDLVLERGRTHALVGESGCGKSMTALALIGLLPEGGHCTGGEIRLDGENLARLRPEAWPAVRGCQIGMIFQDPGAALDPLMTIGGQIAEALALRGLRGRRALRNAAREMLAHVGIPDPDKRLDQYAFELSGGMAQRAMIAIALAARPAVLIADEPTTALDVTIQAQILALMQELQAESGTAILLITHDMGVVSENSDRISVMYAGTVIENGDTEAVMAAPKHPYTRALLRSIPSLDAPRGAPLDVIEGSVPEPSRWPPGCRFAPRCPGSVDACRAVVPRLEAAGAGHTVACVRHGEIS